MKKATKWMLGVLLLVGLATVIVIVMAGCSLTNRQAEQGVEARTESRSSALTYKMSPPRFAAANERIATSAVPGERDEELWIIEKNAQAAPVPPGNEDGNPGSGALMAKLPDKTEQVPVPLKHTNVKAGITGYIATVDVTQQYHNPYNTKIEAVYLFPLPHNAAVSEFVMTVGDRKIRGIIREREEAKRIYQEARSQGYVASLLTQERPNIFTQKVANIEPGKQININIRYFHTLAYVDGWFEFVFPMVVGPRFNPPGSTDGVGAVGRSSAGVSGQRTEVQYLRPNQRSGHDISLTVDIDAGVVIERLDSRNHLIVTKAKGGSKATVALAGEDSIPNKDFVLRYQVAGKAPKSALFVQRDQRGGYFTLMMIPPESLADTPRQPLEMVFTLDVSGSMSGRPVEQSKAAMRYALTHMDGRDTFQVIRFGSHSESFFDKPKAATDGNVRKALDWIEKTQANSGTMMVEGVKASLDFPHDEERLRVVAFLTDGFIGNEADVLREIHGRLGPSRIFSFGVGSSPNRYLLEHMAKMGNGAVAFVGLNDPADEPMAAFFDRISHAAMTDITADWGSMAVNEIHPRRMPDLLVGRPVILTGRFSGTAPTAITLRGRVGENLTEMRIPVNAGGISPSPTPIAPIWARARMADMMDQSIWQPNESLPREVRQLALEYGLMSAYTAFVAVDSSIRTAGDHGISVAFPVPVPDGVKYETTVEEKK